ncbi:MAG: SDR family oxidoreductase [Candidatus Gastranaerophilales bacterium]|nr:SDR family oxidoreductase [Candidatus Gastranaerophilales bacterium]
MKNVLITGSSSGIGKETARLLLQNGYRVFQTGRKKLNIDNYLSIDLSIAENVRVLYDYVKEHFGSVDILVNNAGVYFCMPVEKMSFEDIIYLFNLNFISHALLSKLVIPDMKNKKFGRIVNISSISGLVGEAYASIYSASKSAFYGFSKSLALELAPFNITVNSISPGWVNTELSKNALSDDERKETEEIIPQKRFVEPIEVANLVKYLISDNAKGITGQNINLCAGLTCGC